MQQEKPNQAGTYPVCPECNSGALYYDGVAREWVCPLCGYTQEKPPVDWQNVED